MGHYNPDFVVSAYHNVGENPWLEARLTLGTVVQTAGQTVLAALTGVFLDGGDRSEGTDARDHKNLIFKEADVIGHPVASLTWLASVTGLICPSASFSFFPYFVSTLDALAWRFGIPEMVFPQALVPGWREIGNFPWNTWGAVYPRSGFVTSAEDPKAGAVAAQRAGDIVTRAFQPHVYVPVAAGTILTGSWWRIDNWVTLADGGGNPVLDAAGELIQQNQWEPGFSGMRVWRPPPLQERGFTTRPARRSGLWQMLTPIPEATCNAFGANDTVSLTGWSFLKNINDGDYAWNLWRPYKCCRRVGQTFLYSIDVIDYPL